LGAHRWKDNANLDCFALHIDNVAMRALSIPFKVERDTRRSDPQILNPKRSQEWRQMRVDDGQLAAVCVGPKPKQASK
jgi:hypothetical protein